MTSPLGHIPFKVLTTSPSKNRAHPQLQNRKRATPILVGAIAAEQGNVDLALMDGRAAARRPAAASLLVVVKLPKLIRPLPVLVLRQCRVNVKAAVAVRVVAANEGRESE